MSLKINKALELSQEQLKSVKRDIKALLSGYNKEWARDESLTEKSMMTIEDQVEYNFLYQKRKEIRSINQLLIQAIN